MIILERIYSNSSTRLPAKKKPQLYHLHIYESFNNGLVWISYPLLISFVIIDESSSVNTQSSSAVKLIFFSHQNSFIRYLQLYILLLWSRAHGARCFCHYHCYCIAVAYARVKVRCDQMRSGSTHMFVDCFWVIACSHKYTHQPICTQSTRLPKIIRKCT